MTLFPDPSYGLNVTSQSAWAIAGIDFYMNGDDKIEDACSHPTPRSRHQYS